MAAALSCEYLLEPLTVHISSSPEYVLSILRRSPNFLDLFPAHAQPEFFFVSLTSDWVPHVAIVRHRGKIVAVVYAKEKLFAGFGTGILHVDVSLGIPAISSDFGVLALQAATNTFLALPGFRSLRWIVPEDDGRHSDLCTAAAQAYEAHIVCSPVNHHRALPLTNTYEGFLEGLQPLMRQVLQQDRAVSVKLQENFVSTLPPRAFQEALSQITGHNPESGKQAALASAVAALAVCKNSFQFGIRASDCRWIGVLAGWRHGTRAYVLLEAARESTSALAAYAIETLISQGVREIVLLQGGGGILRLLSHPIPALQIDVDKKGLMQSAVRIAARLLRRVAAPTPMPAADLRLFSHSEC